MEANRLEPGMAFGGDTVLFGDLSLEEMHLRAVRRQRVEAIRLQSSLARTQNPLGAVGEDRVQVHFIARLRQVAEKGGDALAVSHCIQDGAAELREAHLRNPPASNRFFRMQDREAIVVHHLPSKRAAASRKSDSRGGGT